MKRIVYLTPLYFNERSCLGGGERYPLNCARGVVEHAPGDYCVDIISYDKLPSQHVIQPGVTLRLLSAVNQNDPLNVLSWDIPAAIADADLVHIHQAAMRASEVSLWVAKQQRKLVCLTDHGSTTSTVGIFPNRLELADQIVCYSDYGVSLLHTRTPIEVIRGGVDTTYFCPPSVPPRRDRVLYVGRLVPYKGVDLLIEALPADLPLTICGRPYHSEFYRRLKTLAQGKRVEFVLDADDDGIRELYRRAWVNVLPTQYKDCYGHLQPAPELMGLTLLEAMACGTPVICSDAGAMHEFVRQGETGFVFRNPRELTDYLLYVAHNATAVESMGKQARETAVEEYDYRVVGRKLHAIYERMIQGAREAAA